jgi:sugar/nucleoside kinase (ribokinase family)
MNILVIGHLCYDEIHIPGRTPVSGFGGIYYAVGTLAAIAGSDHKIIPVFGVGKDRKDELLSRLSTFPNVVTDGIFDLEGPTNTVKLFYDDGEERIECSDNIAPPIPVSAVQPYLKRSDAILINMVSGFDVTFDMLYLINEGKGSRNVPVYLDIHSMTLGIGDKNKRFRRPVMDWRRWVFHTNIVQMNELEAATLTVERLSEEQLAKIMMTLGPTVMIITRGNRGVSVFQADKKKITKEDIRAVKVTADMNKNETIPPADSTGCGDVFGAAYILHYAKTKDAVASAQFANRIAARRITLPGSDELSRLSDELRQEAK